jgi:hypothetical protein
MHGASRKGIWGMKKVEKGTVWLVGWEVGWLVEYSVLAV